MPLLSSVNDQRVIVEDLIVQDPNTVKLVTIVIDYELPAVGVAVDIAR